MAKKEIAKNVSAATLKEMCDDKFKGDFTNLLKSRYPMFYVVHNEERRFTSFLEHYCRVNGYACYLWDAYNGLIELESEEEVGSANEDLKHNPPAILDYIIGESKEYEDKKVNITNKKDKGVNGIIYVLLDFFRFIEDNPDIERRFKVLSKLNSIVCTIITGPYYKSTDVLNNLIPVVDFPFANKQEIKHALHDVMRGAKGRIPGIEDKTMKMEEQLIDAVSGLTLIEAQTAFSKSLVAHHDWIIPTILEEKRQIISKGGMLEYFDKVVPMENIGGLKTLVDWIINRRNSFSREAEEYGLKKPRGLLTIGMPGCGKSLVCKAISSAWQMPLLRLDFGKLFGSLVGDSEKNAREAIKMAEAVAPSILWIDEIEKAIAGITSSGNSDAGTTSRVLSTFLTWMQEKTSPVFVVATANNHEAIPPEFLRAGRFDEIFFVDLPNEEERKEIFEILLKLRNIDYSDMNLGILSKRSDKYSGAEIEKGIDNAMLTGYGDNKRPITEKDIIKALEGFKPLAVMREDDFETLRDWATTRCLKANKGFKKKVSLGHNTSKRKLDLD